MTPALLERLKTAANTIVTRYARPVVTPITATIDPNNSFTIQPSPPMVFEQGQVAVLLQQATVQGAGFHNINPGDLPAMAVHALKADIAPFVQAVKAGTMAGINHNSSVLVYQKDPTSGHQLSIGVGPSFTPNPNPTGNAFYGQCIFGPIPVTQAALDAFLAGLTSMASQT
jgi:hypothetical protein